MASGEITKKTIYLRRGILALIVWVVFAFYMFDEVKEIDGLVYIINSIKEGSYKPIFIVALSVVLLAYVLRNIVFYFKPNTINEKNHT